MEEPSWNIAASFDAGAFQSGASWLSPLGFGAAAVSPPKASPQREQSEVRSTETGATCRTRPLRIKVAVVGGAHISRARTGHPGLMLAVDAQL